MKRFLSSCLAVLALAACVGAEVGPIDDPGPGPEAGTEPVLLQRSDDAVTGAVQLGRSVSTAALRCASAGYLAGTNLSL